MPAILPATTYPPGFETVIRLDAECNGLELSPDEFDRIEDWDPEYRYELIRGVVVVSPIAGEWEADPNEQLAYLLRLYQNQHPQGHSLDCTMGERYVYLPDGTRRRADRLIWAGLGRLPNPKLDVPTIAVEFVSKSRRDHQRDYIIKRQEYLSLGIREYWVIDRHRNEMHVYTPNSEARIPRGDKYRTALLPGFELPLADLLDVANRWDANA